MIKGPRPVFAAVSAPASTRPASTAPATSTAPAKPADPDELYGRAAIKHVEGNLAAAMDLVNQALQLRPAFRSALLVRAQLKWQLKDQSGARADIAAIGAMAGSMPEENAEDCLQLAIFHSLVGEHAKAIPKFTQGIALLPRMPAYYGKNMGAEFHRLRALSHFELKQLKEARADVDKALSANPKLIEAVGLRALINEQENKVPEAIADFGRLLELNPALPDIVAHRAGLRLRLLDWDGALAEVGQVLAKHPNNEIALRTAGYAQFGRGDFAAAATTFARAAEAVGAGDHEGAAFPLIVRHFALRRTGGSDSLLADRLGQWNEKPWVQALARFATRQLSEDGLDDLARQAKPGPELAGRLCELHFYVGLARLEAGDKSTARLRFRSAVETDQRSFNEHYLAQAELKRLSK